MINNIKKIIPGNIQDKNGKLTQNNPQSQTNSLGGLTPDTGTLGGVQSDTGSLNGLTPDTGSLSGKQPNKDELKKMLDDLRKRAKKR